MKRHPSPIAGRLYVFWAAWCACALLGCGADTAQWADVGILPADGQADSGGEGGLKFPDALPDARADSSADAGPDGIWDADANSPDADRDADPDVAPDVDPDGSADVTLPDGLDLDSDGANDGAIDSAIDSTDPDVPDADTPHVELCDPCDEDEDCAEATASGAVCWREEPTGPGFCVRPCAAVASPCPTGFSCDDGNSALCLPDEACSCSEFAVAQALSTSCLVENEHGVCTAEQVCTPSGLTACAAATPAEETCNGVDDDCDGATDEGTCSDGVGCTVDSCDPIAGCQHALPANTCLVDGICYGAGAASPTKLCFTCQPDKSTTSFRPISGVGCNDGDPCTKADQCDQGQCRGTPIDCGDGGACATATCEVGFCQTTPLAQGSPCDDGDPCTKGDTCQSGQCIGTPLNCSNLSGPCVAGTCVQGGCVATPVPGVCDDGNACTTGGSCQNGLCVGTPKDCSAWNGTCLVGSCQAATGQCASLPFDGACDDGDACTVGDHCAGGSCTGVPLTDGYEPNNSYYGPKLAEVSDCDSGLLSIEAQLHPAGDEDWFWFSTADEALCTLEPKVILTMPAGVNYQLCAYYECGNGENVKLTCLSGTKTTTGPKPGVQGCCSTKTGSQTETVQLSPECSLWSAGDESGIVDIRVWSVSGSTCAPYTLSFGEQ